MSDAVPELATLAGLPLPGGRIRQARWNPGGHVLELLLRYRDPERGELAVLLRYRGVQLLEPALPRFAALVEDVARVISGSVVRVSGGVAEHALTLDAGASVLVRFAALELSEQFAWGEDQPGVPRFQVLSC